MIGRITYDCEHCTRPHAAHSDAERDACDAALNAAVEASAPSPTDRVVAVRTWCGWCQRRVFLCEHQVAAVECYP